jgi:hypothetical protein
MPSIPTQITFRGLPTSAALESDILDGVDWLEQFSQDIVSCRVIVDQPHRHRQDGRLFHVRIELTIPGRGTIVVDRAPGLATAGRNGDTEAKRKESDSGEGHRFAHVAVREAFETARRRLQDVVHEQRGDVKAHSAGRALAGERS